MSIVVTTPEELALIVERAVERALASVRAPTTSATVSIKSCGLPPLTRKKATRAGKLPTFKVGRELHVRRTDVAALIESGRVEVAGMSPELARATRGGR